MSIDTLREILHESMGRDYFASLVICLEWDGEAETIQPFVRNPPNPMLTMIEWQALKGMVDAWYSQISDEAIAAHNRAIYTAYLQQIMERATEPKTPAQPISGVIYILAGGGYHKIGKATEISRRMAQIEPTLPFETEIVHTIPSRDITATEKELHERFADKRVNGEWFILNDADLEWIKHYGNH